MEERDEIPLISRILSGLFIRKANPDSLFVISYFVVNYQKPPALRPPGGLFTRMQALRASSTSSVRINALMKPPLNETPRGEPNFSPVDVSGSLTTYHPIFLDYLDIV